MSYVFEINGGVGKHIMATSLIKWINEKFPKKKITIISGYPEIFEYNPRIHRNLRMQQSYLFEDYIKGNDLRAGEVYKLYDYYKDKDKKHLMELLPKAYGFNEENKHPETEVYLTRGEEMDGKVYNAQNGPLITFQPFGGLPPGSQPNRQKMDANQRDLPPELAEKIVHLLVSKGFKVLQIRGPTERPLQHTLQLELPFRNFLPIFKYCVGHVGIDSSGMHASAIFKKPQLIFWGHTHKDNLGYKYEGVFNAHNKYGMHCRPHIQVPDVGATFPYRDKNDGLEFEYAPQEINDYIDTFVKFVQEKLKGGVK